MDNNIKKVLRKSKFVINIYRALKNAVVYPLKFTSLKTLQLTNFPLMDLFNPKKTSILKVTAPYSITGYPRLSNVYDLSVEIEEKKLPGAFIECGTWKGGSSATMSAVANRYKSGRKTWYMDSFEGMPDKASEVDTDNPERIMGDVLKVSVSDVEELIFGKLNLPRENNIIVKGWFQDTLPKNKKEIGNISLLRLDADWYEATLFCLRELYDQIVPGGYIIFDDFGSWRGCRQAVKEFIAEKDINPEFQFIGTYGKKRPMYFKKR